MFLKSTLIGLILTSSLSFAAFAQSEEFGDFHVHDDSTADFEWEMFDGYEPNLRSCQRADQTQIDNVNSGNRLKEEFLRECARANNNSSWCNQLIRPNPDSKSVFQCTYGSNQVHQLIHPDRSTWKNAFQAVKLIEELQAKKIYACLIYNWWRPEPYNKNVGGASGRHPYGTSVDVRFCSEADVLKAHAQLCKWRSQGRLRALGYYGSTALHLGIGDRLANTWGKECP